MRSLQVKLMKNPEFRIQETGGKRQRSEVRDQRSEKRKLWADLLCITNNISCDLNDFYDFYDLNDLNGFNPPASPERERWRAGDLKGGFGPLRVG